MPENRRVRQTKGMLKDAILELLEERSLERITVTDICRLADVNRSTFYAHYEDVRALLREIEDDMLAQTPALPYPYANVPDRQGCAALTEFLTYVKNHERLYRVMLVRRDSGEFFNRAVCKMMEKAEDFGPEPEGLHVQYDCAYRLNGTIGVMREWIQDGFPLSPEEMARLIWYRRLNAPLGN